MAGGAAKILSGIEAGRRRTTGDRPLPTSGGASRDHGPTTGPRIGHEQPSAASSGHAHEQRLAVLPHQVVDSTDGRASDGGVVPVMVIHVKPLVESSGSCCL